MAGSSLLALIDDISTVLDDVATMTKVAARKTAGVLGDDLALNAQQVTGVRADRELPVVWAVAKGSFVNKAILVPAALAISAMAPWAITPLLMLGGLFLCFEGAEKLLHAFLHKKSEEDARHVEMVKAVADETVDLVAFEKDKIKGAVRTDFILSAEIIVITLGTVAAVSMGQRVAVLVGISLIMTIGVYGLERANVGELMPELNQLFGPRSNTPLAGMVRFLPIERTNAIVAISSQPEYLNEVGRWIDTIDQGGGYEPQMYVYDVRNMKASDLARYRLKSPASSLALLEQFVVTTAADVDLAERQALAGTDHARLHQRVLVRQRLEEAGVHLHRGARPEFAEMADQGQHHRGVGGGHHGLAAQHAAGAAELIALRQAQGHAVGVKALDFQVQGLYPRGKQVGQGLLEAVGGHGVAVLSKTRERKTPLCSPRPTWAGRERHGQTPLGWTPSVLHTARHFCLVSRNSPCTTNPV